MNDRESNLFWFRWELVSEHFAEEAVHDGVQALFDESIPVYARATREIHARLAPLLLALRDASTTAPDARAIWDEIGERRAMNMRQFAKDLKSVGGIRAGLSISEAADTIWVTNRAEVYVLLTTERGWPPHRFERWLADTWSCSGRAQRATLMDAGSDQVRRAGTYVASPGRAPTSHASSAAANATNATTT